MGDRDPSDELQRLRAIVGDWRTSGHVVGDPPVPVSGSDVYELLAGGHFLVHHVDVTVGDQEVQAIEIIGEPSPQPGALLARSFDNEGNVELMHVTVDGEGIFHFSGGPDVAQVARPDAPTAAAERVRATLTVAPTGDAMTALWERSADGVRWDPWMHIEFTRNPRSER